MVIFYVYEINDENVFIPDRSIRLRVIPNSNDPEDIYIKEQIKDYLEDSARSRMEVDVARREIERLNREISNLRNKLADK